MQKRYCLLILAFAILLGTTVASLPIQPVKAQDTVRFYVSPTIYPATSVGGYVDVEVWIDSPSAGDDAAIGIVGWALSVRVDPRALRVDGGAKIPGSAGFLEAFLSRYNYARAGYSTSFLVGETDPETGTTFDVSEYIMAYETLGKGGGGGPTKLCVLYFTSRSDEIASPIDIFGIQAPPIVEVVAMYTTPDGVDHYVDVLDDGYYIAQTPGRIFFDSSQAWASDPTMDPIGTDWHELWPVGCQWWTLESWNDIDGDSVLSVSDEVDMICLDTGFYAWYYVVWVNPAPGSNDGKLDLEVEFKEEIVPEFPLGVGLMIAIAPTIPIVYLWRKGKWVGPK